MPGSIKLILGPMYSGKTSELLRIVQRCALSRERRTCTLIKFRGDTRYDAVVNCATEGEKKARVISHDYTHGVADASVDELTNVVANTHVVAVDEGQFFPDLVARAVTWRNEGREVVIAALNATATQTMFPVIAQLLPHVNGITYLTAVCMVCGGDAMYSKKTSSTTTDSAASSTAATPDIGGLDKYTAVCEQCL